MRNIDESDINFAQNLLELIKSACASIDSALMSDEFMKIADESLGEIPNIAGDSRAPVENNVDPPNSS